MLQGYKEIAEYITRRASVCPSLNALRKASLRRRDPLPVRSFAGRIYADPKALDAWIARQSVRPTRPARAAR